MCMGSGASSISSHAGSAGICTSSVRVRVRPITDITVATTIADMRHLHELRAVARAVRPKNETLSGFCFAMVTLSIICGYSILDISIDQVANTFSQT
jgi:hypothetical protein